MRSLKYWGPLLAAIGLVALVALGQGLPPRSTASSNCPSDGGACGFVSDGGFYGNAVADGGIWASLGGVVQTFQGLNTFSNGITVAEGDAGGGYAIITMDGGTLLIGPAGLQAVGNIKSNQTDGGNAFSVLNSGGRVDFGAGASDYATSDGTTVTFAGPLAITGALSGVTTSSQSGTATSTVASGSDAVSLVAGARVRYAPSGTDANAFLSYNATLAAISAGSDNLGAGRVYPGTTVGVYFDGNGTIGLRASAGLMMNIAATISKPTCAVGVRGSIWYTASGAGVSDKFEICVKSAADGYAWQSMNTAIP